MSNDKMLENALRKLCSEIDSHVSDIPSSVMSSYISEHMEKSKSLNELSSALYNCMMLDRERPSKSDWISVDDDLPDSKDVVIVRCEGDCSSGYHEGLSTYSEKSGKWLIPKLFETAEDLNVTHWKHMDENPE